MQVIPLYLNNSNQTPAGGLTIGELIRTSGKEHLWNNRLQEHIDTVVIHYASAVDYYPEMPLDVLSIIRVFCNLGVSSHYIIARNGDIYALVPENKRAWHCGGSIMPEPDNRRDVNEFSLGIELVATALSGFTEEQYTSLIGLCVDIENRYKQTIQYVGHEDIAGERAVALKLRSDIKFDPGPMFNWNRLKKITS